MNQQHTPPTIDDIAVILPGLVRALGLIIEQMEPLLDLSRHATNLPKETADRMADIGQALTEHAHTLMREAARRRQSGPGRIALASGPAEPPAGQGGRPGAAGMGAPGFVP